MGDLVPAGEEVTTYVKIVNEGQAEVLFLSVERFEWRPEFTVEYSGVPKKGKLIFFAV